MSGQPVLSAADLRAIRRSRRHPKVTQFDYLHLRALIAGLEQTIAAIPGPIEDVLDVWCGSRPYEDLLPPGARCVGLDVVGNPYGVADVVSDELLPFPEESFDLVTCIEAFQYMPDPARAVSEFARVLRPGGTALVSLVFVFEYDRRLPFEGRYTEQQLRALFADWDDVEVREDGGRATAWAVLTGSLLRSVEQRVEASLARRLLQPAFASGYMLINAVGLALQKAETRGPNRASLPMNLTLTARKPSRG